ncbi:MAG: nucleoside recognition protein [Clostridia bacterium]|nr:nucleoside recognition protein [Clostridia bacterium]
MINYIWGWMILLSLVVGALNGRLEYTVNEGINAAKNSITVVLSFAGIMCMWSGIMKIADDGGISSFIGKLLSPITHFLFPRLKKTGPAMRTIIMNITANLLGMGNAATPLGLKAMGELDKLSANREYATDEMCTFVVLNTASFQLIPTTIIALRAAAGSEKPFEIIVPIWLASGFAILCALVSVKLLSKLCPVPSSKIISRNDK